MVGDGVSNFVGGKMRRGYLPGALVEEVALLGSSYTRHSRGSRGLRTRY